MGSFVFCKLLANGIIAREMDPVKVALLNQMMDTANKTHQSAQQYGHFGPSRQFRLAVCYTEMLGLTFAGSHGPPGYWKFVLLYGIELISM